MALKQVEAVQVAHWRGSQHPTLSVITRMMNKEGLRPYVWENTPNRRYGVRSHGYAKIMYVIDGTLEITLPDSNQRVVLRPGDRVEIPAGVRHGTNVGTSGSRCLEAALPVRP
jgi:quercetin dioxygenase-like cupin family protein